MDIVLLLVAFVIGGTIAWYVCSLMMKLKMVSKEDHDRMIQSFNQLQTDIELAKQKNALIEQEKTNLQNEIHDYKFQVNLLEKDIHAKDKEISILTANRDAVKESSNIQLQDLNQNKIDLKTKTEDYNELNKTTAALTADNRSLEEKLNTQKLEMEGLRKQFNLEFEHIASKILDEKSNKFTKLNQDNLTGILKPLGENIEMFRKKVEEVYITEAKERFSLGEEVKKLQVLNTRLSEEATNLTNALTRILKRWRWRIFEK